MNDIDKKFDALNRKIVTMTNTIRGLLMEFKADVQSDFKTHLDSTKRSILYDINAKTESVKAAIAEVKGAPGGAPGQKSVLSLMNSFNTIDFPITTEEKFNELDTLLLEPDKKNDMV